MAAASSAQCNASLRVARRSGCPSPRWQDEIAPILSARLANGTSGDPFCYINVGANKGYNVAETLQRYHSRGAGPRTSAAWHKELLKGSPKGMRVKYGCGLCNPCKQPPPPKRYHVPVEVHALEMVDVNAQALRRLFGVFSVPGHAWHLAVSNFTGTAQYRAAPFVGLEHYELGKGTNRQVSCWSRRESSIRFGCFRMEASECILLYPPQVECHWAPLSAFDCLGLPLLTTVHLLSASDDL
jgi:hypothetical protein